MLEQSLLELAVATCFSSPTLADKLRHVMHKPTTIARLDRATFHASCHEALCLDLDDDYPRRFRRNDIDQALQVAWHKAMFMGEGGAAIPMLDQLFDRLLLAHGDQIQYRDDRVQEYARFAARIDPALLVGWRLAKRISEQPWLKPHDVVRLVATQQPFFSPLPVAGKAYAENHVHVGGVHYAGMALMTGLLPVDATSASNTSPKVDATFLELQRLAHGLLEAGNLLPATGTNGNAGSNGGAARNGQKLASDPVQNAAHEQDPASRVQSIIDNALGMHAAAHAPGILPWTWLAQQDERVSTDNPRWVRQQIARAVVAEDMGQAWMWFLLWLWLHYQHPDCDPRLRMTIIYLLNGLMRIRRKLIMDGQGLSRFVEYYGRDERKAPADLATVSAATTLFQGPDDVAELKVMGDRLKPKRVAGWLRHLARASNVPGISCTRPYPTHAMPAYRAMMDRWHYCVHFSRGKDFLHAPQKAWHAANDLQKQLEKQSGWNLPEMLAPDNAPNAVFDPDAPRLIPSRWLRGLDVAGDENLTKTEIWAPAMRWLREGMRSKNEVEPASNGLHLSVHTGEDYAHPLSGMRHVDETVLFCEMRSGDRLGHALALGIRATDWIAAHGEILLPVEEHLDNLVWAWHYASILATRLPLAAQVLPILARRIQKNLISVPWAHGACLMMEAKSAPKAVANAKPQPRHCPSARRMQEFTPEHLFQAWRLRRNCSWQLKQYEELGEIPDRKIRVGVPDLKKLMTRCDDEEARHPEEGKHLEERYAPDVALYRQRWNWLAPQAGGKARPNVGCEQIGRAKTVRIRLECNLHDEFDAISVTELDPDLLEDSHSQQELMFFDALQDWLLDTYDQKGLVIEVNPTSNVYIARLNKHADHPVFRWYPPDEALLLPGAKHNPYGLRRGPIRVCINTDDPGIMPTTLRTEFALLREAALEHGVTRTHAENWLERLRQFGLDEFRQKHQAVWAQGRVTIPAAVV